MKLYLIPTPIGNLEDMTLRSIRVLKEVDVIFAEDTRTSGQLLKHLDISKPLFAHHAHNEHVGVAGVIKLLKEGKVVGLISDAGTPGISDPGFLLVKTCIEQGIDVETLPGATALIPALVNSGFPLDRFVFEGFLPHKKGRQTRWKAIAEEERTTVLYESPQIKKVWLILLQEVTTFMLTVTRLVVAFMIWRLPLRLDLCQISTKLN